MGLTRVPVMKPGVGEWGIIHRKRGLALQSTKHTQILLAPVGGNAVQHPAGQSLHFRSQNYVAHKHPACTQTSHSLLTGRGLPTYFKRRSRRNASQGWGFARAEGWAGWSGHQAPGLHTPCPVHSQHPSSGTSKTSSLSPPHPPEPEGAEGRPCQTTSPEAFVPIHSAHPLGAEGGRGLLCCCFAAQKGEKRQLLWRCWYSAEVGCPSREATWATETTNIPSGSSPKLAANLLQAYGQSIVMFKSLHLFLIGELVSLFWLILCLQGGLVRAYGDAGSYEYLFTSF